MPSPEQDAHELERRHPQRAPLEDRRERESDVHRPRRRESKIVPGRLCQTATATARLALGRRDGNQSERMVREMRGHVREQDEPRAEPQVATA